MIGSSIFVIRHIFGIQAINHDICMVKNLSGVRVPDHKDRIK